MRSEVKDKMKSSSTQSDYKNLCTKEIEIMMSQRKLEPTKIRRKGNTKPRYGMEGKEIPITLRYCIDITNGIWKIAETMR